MPGQEGVAAVYSPMARTLEDLDFFWKAVVSMQPWKYDPSVNLFPLCIKITPYMSSKVPSNSMADR